MKNVAVCYRGMYKNLFNKERQSRSFEFNQNILNNHIEQIFKYYNCSFYLHSYTISENDDKKLIELFQNNNLKLRKFCFDKLPKKKNISNSIIKSFELIDDNYDFIINIRFDLYFKISLPHALICRQNEEILEKKYRSLNKKEYKNLLKQKIINSENSSLVSNTKVLTDIDKIYFPFRCQFEDWKKNKNISDLFYIVPNKYKQDIINSIKSKKNRTKNGNAHLIYKKIIKLIGENNVGFLDKGLFQSNTDKQDNPIVKIIRL